MADISRPTPTERAMIIGRTNKQLYDASKERAAFAHRGFSARLVDALVACGVDAPERLLFMGEAGLKKIPGVGPKTLKEIMDYRRRFLGD